MATDVGEHDILTAIEVPVRAAGQGSAYVKFEHPASRYAVIGVAAVVTVTERRRARPRRSRSAAWCRDRSVPRRWRQALVGQALSPEAIADAAARVGDDLGGDTLGDIYASAEYRTAVAPVYVKRALAAAASRRADGRHPGTDPRT